MRSRQHRQPTAQLAMLHSRAPPRTPLASYNESTAEHDPDYLVSDSNIASLYTGHSAATPQKARSSPRALPPEEKEIDPVNDGALQFVPAFADADWGAILDDDDEKKESEDAPRSAVTPATKGRISPFCKLDNSSSSAVSASAASRRSGGGGGRSISRIKSLFSSRANTPNTPKQAAAPPSPAHSSGSSGFVGWPGTQDAAGKTVPLSSYDDSSAGPSGAAKFDELHQAEQQISRWTAQTSATTADDFSSVDSFPSPIRATATTPKNSNVDISDLSFGDHPQSAAEFHLAAAVADANAAAAARRGPSVSAMRYAEAERSRELNTSAESGSNGDLHQAVPLIRSNTRSSPSAEALINNSNRARNSGRSLTSSAEVVDSPFHNFDETNDSWGPESNASASKTSSAYFNTDESDHFDYPGLKYSDPIDPDDVYTGPVDLDDSPEDYARRAASAYRPYDQRQSENAVAAAADVLQRSKKKKKTPQPPTEDALEFNNHLSPPHRNFTTSTSKGFRGLLDKTKAVPSLMDNLDSDSMSSSKATSVVSSGPSNTGSKRISTNSRSRMFRDDSANTGIPRYTDDNDGESVSDIFDGLSISKESDVFDNLSFSDAGGPSPRKTIQSGRHRASYPERILEEPDHLNTSNDVSATGEEFKVVALGGGLTAIQATKENFSNRRTPSDYDDNLTNSDISSNGFTKLPGYHEMVTAGMKGDSSLRGIHGNIGAAPRVRQGPTSSVPSLRTRGAYERRSDTGSSHTGSSYSNRSSLFTDPYRSDSGLDVYGDLSEYYVQPELMKKVVRKYRSLSDKNSSKLGFAEFEKEEDEHKAFALFEMRSRIMEKDIERGLERRGGTFPVDDLVTTPYNRTAHRIRDAVIVSKAWRDGATISDVINTALLTRRSEHTYFIKRPVVNDNASSISGFSMSSRRYTWEAVRWLDDTDFMQYRCPSLGSRHMLGFEMFTIGDCQSILLKLTNERCMELRRELNEATARQILAEELLKEEGDNLESMMSENEMAYLAAMEEVKTISKKLVNAEQAFTLVRERVEKLISRYDAMLLKIENGSFAGASSVVTYESSYYSDYENSEYWAEDRERWARRAQRAEVRAEIAAREALLARQEARMIQEEKVRELEILNRKLLELQSVSSVASAEREKAALARTLSTRRHTTPGPRSAISQPSASRASNEKLDTVKQRFRDRMAARKQQSGKSSLLNNRSGRAPLHPSAHRNAVPSPRARAERELILSAGEEMYQQMGFYERSLKAVDNTRNDF